MSNESHGSLPRIGKDVLSLYCSTRLEVFRFVESFRFGICPHSERLCRVHDIIGHFDLLPNMKLAHEALDVLGGHASSKRTACSNDSTRLDGLEGAIDTGRVNLNGRMDRRQLTNGRIGKWHSIDLPTHQVAPSSPLWNRQGMPNTKGRRRWASRTNDMMGSEQDRPEPPQHVVMAEEIGETADLDELQPEKSFTSSRRIASRPRLVLVVHQGPVGTPAATKTNHHHLDDAGLC